MDNQNLHCQKVDMYYPFNVNRLDQEMSIFLIRISHR